MRNLIAPPARRQAGGNCRHLSTNEKTLPIQAISAGTSRVLKIDFSVDQRFLKVSLSNRRRFRGQVC